MSRPVIPIRESLQTRSMKTHCGCVLWMGALTGAGYGAVNVGNKQQVSTHRAAYEVAFGKIPRGLLVLHKCDIPSCINPDHLFVGTYKDNMQDRSSKNRAPLGMNNGNHKLTTEQVLSIRQRPMSIRKLAVHYRVSKSTIEMIQSGTTWRHV